MDTTTPVTHRVVLVMTRNQHQHNLLECVNCEEVSTAQTPCSLPLLEVNFIIITQLPSVTQTMLAAYGSPWQPALRIQHSTYTHIRLTIQTTSTTPYTTYSERTPLSLHTWHLKIGHLHEWGVFSVCQREEWNSANVLTRCSNLLQGESEPSINTHHLYPHMLSVKSSVCANFTFILEQTRTPNWNVSSISSWQQRAFLILGRCYLCM